MQALTDALPLDHHVDRGCMAVLCGRLSGPSDPLGGLE